MASSHNAAKQRLKMKVQILHALETLLEEHDYNSVEINDICKVAHISKPTFYRYFKNKDNIFRWMSKVAFKTGIAEIGRKFTWYEGYLITLMVSYRHKVFYTGVKNPEIVSTLIDLGWRYQYDALTETLTKYHGIEVDELLSYQIEGVSLMQCYMTRKWGAEGMKVPPERMAEYLAKSTPENLYQLLNDPLKNKVNFADKNLSKHPL